MSRYLIDTHIAYWIISDGMDRIPDSVLDGIFSFRDSYCVSAASLVEMSDKQRKGALRLNGTPSMWRDNLAQWNIEVVPVDTEVVDTFHAQGIPESQQLQHKDPFDRLIISTALAHRMTLISADRKFPWWHRYRKLDLLYIGQ